MWAFYLVVQCVCERETLSSIKWEYMLLMLFFLSFAKLPRLASHQWSSYLSLSSPEITDLYHHIQPVLGLVGYYILFKVFTSNLDITMLQNQFAIILPLNIQPFLSLENYCLSSDVYLALLSLIKSPSLCTQIISSSETHLI